MWILSVILAFTGVILCQGAEWTYPDLEKDEKFAKWGGICDKGVRQSPIDLSTIKAFKGVFSNFTLENYDKPLENPRIINNGHTLKLLFNGPELKIGDGPLEDEDYILQEIHFHWFSEHTIDERRYHLEMHLVHRNDDYANMTESLRHKDGVLVLSVLFHITDEDNPHLEEIVNHTTSISDSTKIGIEQPIPGEIILDDLMPDDPSDGYFYYHGSLTTPSCDEAVTWVVYTDSEPVSMDQIKDLQKLEESNGEEILNNFRNIQEIRNRVVIYVPDDEKDDDDDDDDDDNHDHMHKECKSGSSSLYKLSGSFALFYLLAITIAQIF